MNIDVLSSLFRHFSPPGVADVVLNRRAMTGVVAAVDLAFSFSCSGNKRKIWPT
jgi:hypothetical protein